MSIFISVYCCSFNHMKAGKDSNHSAKVPPIVNVDVTQKLLMVHFFYMINLFLRITFKECFSDTECVFTITKF